MEAIYTKFSAQTSLDKSVWSLFWGSPKFYWVRTIFVTDWAQKTSLTKFVLKRSVLLQSLPNFHHNLFETSQYEGSTNFFEGLTRFVTDWAQKTSLIKLVTKRSVLKQFLPTSHHTFFRLVSMKAAQNFFWGAYQICDRFGT